MDLNGSVVRLQHYFTGKVLRNWINVTHLRRLRDEGRLKLYNRLNAQNSDANIVSGTDQPTVQTAIQLYFTERGRGYVANDPSGPIDCDSTPTQQQQGLHGPQTVCHTASTADFSVPRTAQLLSPDAPEWYPQGHETDSSPCFETQLRPTDIVQSVALPPDGKTNSEVDQGATDSTLTVQHRNAVDSRQSIATSIDACQRTTNEETLAKQQGPESRLAAREVPFRADNAQPRQRLHTDVQQHEDNAVQASRMKADRKVSILYKPAQNNASQQTHADETSTQTDARSRTYMAYNCDSKEAQYDYRIHKITACKRRQQAQPLFKAYRIGEKLPKWITAQQIPPTILADFYVATFQKKRYAKRIPI